MVILAVGDVVNGLSALNTILNFQPAASTSVMISATFFDNIGYYPVLTDGVLSSYLVNNADNTNYGNLKIMITNTNYLSIPALGAGKSSGYTGIQIQ